MKTALMVLRYLKPQPPVMDKPKIERVSLWRSIFWQGEFGSGFGSWQEHAEFEQAMQTQYNVQ